MYKDWGHRDFLHWSDREGERRIINIINKKIHEGKQAERHKWRNTILHELAEEKIIWM